MMCIEVRHAQRFLSSRPVKTDRNDARGIAEMMRLGHYRPVHVKSPTAQLMRTTLAARMQLVASYLQIEGTIRGLLKIYGLKIGAIHRNRFAARVSELLDMAALPELSAAIQPLLRVREGMRTERKAFDRTLAGLSRRDDITRRLMTIPGVGPVTSLAFKAAQKARPIGNRHRRAVLRDLGGDIGLGLVAATLAPHDEPHLGGKRLAQGHRRRLVITLGWRNPGDYFFRQVRS
jgi:transposase